MTMELFPDALYRLAGMLESDFDFHREAVAAQLQAIADQLHDWLADEDDANPPNIHRV